MSAAKDLLVLFPDHEQSPCALAATLQIASFFDDVRALRKAYVKSR